MGLCNCQEVPLISSRNPEGSESSLPHQHCGFLGCLSFQGESHIAHTPLLPSENIIVGVWSVRSEFLRALVTRFSGGSCPWPFPGQEVRGWWHSGGIQAALGCLCQVGQELSLPQPLVLSPLGFPWGQTLQALLQLEHLGAPAAAAAWSLVAPGSSMQGKSIARGLI